MEPWVRAEYSTLRSYGIIEYRESVLRDLSYLMNTRSPVRAADYDKENLTVLDYGIPDFAHYSPESSEDQVLIARSIEHSIRMFEPRLRDPSVSVEPRMPDEKKLAVRIEADLLFNKTTQHLSILTGKQIYSGKWEIYETKWR
jgi:type VI secretion system protein ImpF